MKTKPVFNLLRAAALPLLLSTLNLQLSTAFAQGTAFTYQGRLNEGSSPANGAYDLTFALFDSATGGTQQGDTLTNNTTTVSNGLFTVILDFGNQFPGADRWLEIGVRTNGAGAFATLSPRQPITPTPYSIAAETASNLVGSISSENLAGTYTNALTLNNGLDQFYGTFSGEFYGPLFVGGSFSGEHFGDGSGLYNLNASQLATGTVPAADLANAWKITGNSGTSPGANFVGTTDNQPLELHANNQRIFRLVPDASTNNAPDIIGGSPVNFIAPGIVGSTISGGGTPLFTGRPGTNRILGDFNAIGGGWDNVTGSTNFDVTEATVAGGAHNTASGITSAIGGGANNLAYNNNAVVAGGLQNRAAYHSFVGSGFGNANDGGDNVIGGGDLNSTDTNSFLAVIGGGTQNAILSDGGGSFIGGGFQNTNDAFGAAIVAGAFNNIESNAAYSVIGGGYQNTIQTNTGESAVGGGYVNTIQTGASYSFIGGGAQNSIQTNDSLSVIGGGWLNYIQGNADQSVIAGGYDNSIQNSSRESFIGGGYDNTIAPGSSLGFIGGGNGNLIQDDADHSAIAGGTGNQVLTFAHYSSIGGGINNQAGGAFSTVPGGYYNGATGNYSFAAGTYAQATNDGSFVLTDDEPLYFYSTTSNQFSARFTGGVRFVTGGAGLTIDGLPVVSGNDINAVTLTNGSDTFAGTFSGNGAGLTNVPPASGSTNYIQNQSAGPQAASFNISGNATVGGTDTALALVVSNAQATGVFRSGVETGTADAPFPAGLVVRRINSKTFTAGAVIARSDLLVLQRDGSNGGLQISYPASPGNQTVAAMGMDNNGNQVNFYTAIANPSTAGTIQIYSNAQNVHSCQITFGNTYLAGNVTQVSLSRYLNDNYWVGTVNSTYNQ